MSRDNYEHIFILTRNNTGRVKLPYGGQEAALSVLKLTCTSHSFVEVECPDPGYQTLKVNYLFILDGSYDANKVFTKYVHWLRGVVKNHVWLVQGYNASGRGEDGELLGVSASHETAMKVAGKWDALHKDDEDHYATLQLVKCLE